MVTADTTFQFAEPIWLWGLVLVMPAMIFDYYKRRLVRWSVSSSTIVGDSTMNLRRALEWLPTFLKGLALAALIVAAARPRMVNNYVQNNQQGIDIMLVLDTSDSMHAVDMELDGDEAERMDVVKAVVKSFVSERPSDRIGMVVFGETAYTQCPLTLDHDILAQYLDLIEIGIAGPSTAIGNGIATAAKRLEDSDAKSKVIILITDGTSNSGEVTPFAAADYAAQKGIRIHSIAVGSGDEAPVYVNSILGRRKVMQRLEVDEETLQEISKRTGGTFFAAKTTDMLKSVYEKIDSLEKSENTLENYREYNEYFPSLLPPVMILLLLSWLFRHTLFLRLP